MTTHAMPVRPVVLTLAMLLSACTVGPDFRRPEPPAAERYVDPTPAGEGMQTLSLGEAPPTEWWKLFRSEALDQIVARALQGNRTLTAAQWTLSEAQELANARAGARWPQVDATAGVGREKIGAQFLGSFPKPAPFTYFSVGARVSYALDYTGGLTRSIEQQRALVDYREQQVEAARLAVTGNAITEALRVASLRTQIETVEALLDRDQENLKLVQIAFDAGSVSRLDVVSAQSQLASDTTALSPLRQQLSEARHRLAVTLGNAPAAAAPADLNLAQLTLPDDLPVTLPSELARRRPDILAAEAQLHAATAAVGIAESNLYPHIDLTASLGQQSIAAADLFDSGSGVFGLAADLVAPIFDGGKLRAQKRASVDALHASAANYEQTVLEAFSQVADSLEALNHGAAELQAQANAERAAR
ncbi:efflux transporter outer membrane subunit, partial [Povalibacter sp.]|uniref:efflux transporter outer membrane subunit n=1 Tax=Povalibacter sp. TaxID=1962978 RepID=UPI002F426DDD